VNAPRLFILDCDGVVFDSNGMKAAAFAEVLDFAPPADREAFLEHAHRSFGRGRLDLFAEFVRDFWSGKDPPPPVHELVEAFGQRCEIAYEAVPEAPGLRDFLVATRGRPIWIASGSRGDELRRVFRRRGLEAHFARIEGAPKSKAEIVSEALLRHDCAPEDALYVGDARADLDAALATGVPFVFALRYATDPDALAPELDAETIRAVDTIGDLVAELAPCMN